MSLDSTLTVRAGTRTVAFAFTVTNVGTEPVELEFQSGKWADVAVSDDGTEIWRWSEGRMFTQATETEPLAPGESFTREMTWEDPPPGEYTATASLEATGRSLAERTAFET